LNAKIQQQLRRPSPCWLRLQALKRQRLRVEDKISANRRRRAHSHMVAHDNVK